MILNPTNLQDPNLASHRTSVSAIAEIEDESEWSFRSSSREIEVGRRASISRETNKRASGSGLQINAKQLEILKDFLFDSWTIDSYQRAPFVSTESIKEEPESIFETTFDLTEDRLRRLFDLFDKSNNGLITYDELKLGFKYHAADFGMSNLDNRTFLALINYLDADNSGEITFAEFSEGIRLLMLRSILQQVNRSGSTDAVITQVYDYNITRLERYALQGQGQLEQARSPVAINKSKPLVDFFLHERGYEVSVRWINITGKKASNIMKMMALKYRLHPLALEDALERADHRPKADSYDGHYFIMVPVFFLKEQKVDVTRTKREKLSFYRKLFEGNRKYLSETSSAVTDDSTSTEEEEENESNLIGVHMTSIFVTRPNGKTVITFNNDQNNDGLCWQKLQEELKKDYSKLRQYDGQYFAYRLLDEAVDKIGVIVKKLKGVIKAEKKALIRDHYRDLEHIHSLKQEMYSMHRKFKPFLRLLVHVIEDDSFSPGASIYLRDVLDNLEIHDDDLKNLIEQCDSVDEEADKLQAKQMDSTLYTLTVATVTILPAQFLTGLWGMNFDNMPELHYRYGYYIFWILSIVSGVVTLSILNYSRRARNY